MSLDSIAIELKNVNRSIVSLDKTISKHNGRLRKVEEFMLLAKGGGLALKGVWSVVGVFVIAMAFGVFQMYVRFENLDESIKISINKELSSYEFNIVE